MHQQDVEFYIKEDLWHAVILGYGWMKENAVIMKVPQECLYIGNRDRITVPFTGRGPASRGNAPINTQEIHHGFPVEFLAPFETFIQYFSSVF